MTDPAAQIVLPPLLPDHTQLPDSDGTFVKNFQEHPQSLILTDSIGPILQQLHPDGQYCIGQHCSIYWRETDPPEKGAEAPDWFYVPNVPPKLDGQIRRSYVYELVGGVYHQLTANQRGHYPIPPLGVELGLWQGTYQNQEFLWLRWWDLEGNLLLIGSERAEQERHRAEQESQRAQQAQARAARLAERLRAMGVDLDAEDPSG